MVHLAVQGMQEDEARADYLKRLSTLQQGIAEKAVQLVPRLWGMNRACWPVACVTGR